MNCDISRFKHYADGSGNKFALVWLSNDLGFNVIYFQLGAFRGV